jgi:hypothetical protein
MQLDFKVLFKVFDILSNGCIEGDDHFDHIIVEFLLVSLEEIIVSAPYFNTVGE